MVAESNVLRGGALFDESVAKFGSRATGIEGKWHFGDNLDRFNKLTGQNKTNETAAKGTWTGGKAKEHGFPNVTVHEDKLIGDTGNYSQVEVLFTK